VTINGANFNPIASLNTVQFGSVAATVTSATGNQLKVSVPMDAVTAPIVVTVGGSTATSASSFQVPALAIASVSSMTGAPGTVVIINAPGSSTFLNEDIVKFNGVAATISGVSYPLIYATIPAGASSGPLTLQVGTQTVTAPGTFSIVAGTSEITGNSLFIEPVEYPSPTGSLSTDVVVADFNGDGKLDAAALSSEGVWVYWGTGTGSLLGPTLLPFSNSYSLDVRLFAIDVDGNGTKDIVFGSNSSVFVFLNDGLGHFSQAVTTSLPTNTYDYAWGDVDGDGKSDLVVVAFNGVWWMRNLGNGSFAYQQSVGAFSSSGQFFAHIEAGHFTGAAGADIVASTGESQIWIASSQGAGGFATAALAITPPCGMDGPHPMHVADFNGDGKDDLLASAGYLACASGDFVVYSSLGNGNFGSALISPTSRSVATLQIADIDGDGLLDLAIVDNDYLAILKGNGDGTFAPTNTYLLSPRDVAVGDFNGDGRPDLAVTGSGFSIVFGASSSKPMRAGLIDQSIPANDAVLADLNGDGVPDVVAFSATSVIEVLLGNGDGTYRKVASPASGGRVIAIADINGDGKPDLITTTAINSITVELGNGDGTFQAGSVFAVNSNPQEGYDARVQSVVVADFDGDGKLDVATANLFDHTISILRGTGTGSLDSPSVFNAPACFSYLSFYATDVTGDGIPDLIFPVCDAVTVWAGNGDGSFAATPITTPVFNIEDSLTLADFNHDGRLDIATVVVDPVSDNDAIDILLGNGNGTFNVLPGHYLAPGPQAHIPGPLASTAPSIGALAVGDLDGDGILDLAVVGGNGPNAEWETAFWRGAGVLKGNGDGTFVAYAAVTAPMEAWVAEVADVNGDGKKDLVTLGGGGVTTLLNSGLAPTAIYASTATSINGVTPEPSGAGQSFTVTAAVVPPTPVFILHNSIDPTGTIYISDGTTGCSFDLPGQGCALVENANGTFNLTAHYSGDVFYASSTSSVATHTVSGGASVLITSVNPEPSTINQPYDVAVTVTPMPPSTATPTGTVVVSNGSSNCTIQLPGSSCALTNSLVSTVFLTATYSGDVNYGGSQSAARSHTVSDISSASVKITHIGSEPSAQMASYSVDVSVRAQAPAQSTPGGSVVVSDGSASCTLTLPSTSCNLTSTSAGLKSITASYSGDVAFLPATSAPVSHAVSSLGGPGSLLPGTQLCGFDPNAADQPAGPFVPLEQLNGAVPSGTLTNDIVGSGSLSVSITSLANNSFVPTSTVDISGVFTGPANTGVSINGMVATVANHQFLLKNFPLNTPGAVSYLLTATATTMTGAAATSSITIIPGSTPSPVAIQRVDHSPTGFSPWTQQFSYSIGALPNNGQVASVSIDFDGDGTIDWSGTSLTSAPMSFTYPQAGLYVVVVKVVDNHGAIYVGRTSLIVQDLVATRSVLCSVYGYVKDRLSASDPDAAAMAFASSIRGMYQPFFDSLGTHAPSVASTLGSIASGSVGFGFAEMTLVRDNGDQTRSGFPLRMVMDSDGVWRISEM
jgi:hypothetical protein